MEILFVSPEVVPFSKVGGLADVTGSLPKALRALGHKVTVVSLLYGTIDPTASALARRLVKVQVPLGSQTIQAEVYEARLPSGVNVTLLNAPGLSDRPRIYGEPDDYRRFAFLSRGAIEWARAQPRLPEVIHAHDWATGLLPLFLKLAAEGDARLAQVKTVFTVHDFAAQGLFEREGLAEIGIPDSYFTPAGIEFYGKVSSLKAGVVYADKVTTVSPTYAKEVAAGIAGEGMAGVVRSRGKDFIGILNGIDFAVWNPATDPYLAARYDAEDATPKARCKADLAATVGIAQRPEAPLFGMVARLTTQKGIDLLLEAAPRMMRQDLSLVVLGEGDDALAEGLSHLASHFPERVHFKRGFDDPLAHKIYGGADFFLAPSRVEPSGLAHLYAMRYGALPIVRATGGLRDTVVDADRELESGTGFVFERPDADEFYGAVARALVAWRNREGMVRLRHRVMRKDFSWDRSARQYQALYSALAGGSQEG